MKKIIGKKTEEPGKLIVLYLLHESQEAILTNEYLVINCCNTDNKQTILDVNLKNAELIQLEEEVDFEYLPNEYYYYTQEKRWEKITNTAVDLSPVEEEVIDVDEINRLLEKCKHDSKALNYFRSIYSEYIKEEEIFTGENDNPTA